MYGHDTENQAIVSGWGSENLFVEQWIRHDGGCGVEKHRAQPPVVDNRRQLFASFKLVFDQSHTRYASGYQWFCRNCGMPCSSVEAWFPCQGKFVTIKVMCHLGCHNHWRLKTHVVSIDETWNEAEKRLLC